MAITSKMSKNDSQTSHDELFEVRTAFYLGNFQQCINEAQKLKLTNDETKIQRDTFLFRAYIAQKKYGVPLDEISASCASPALKGVRLLAEYLNSNENKRLKLVEELEKMLNKGTEANNSTFILMAANIYMHETDFDAALRLLHNAEGDDLECMAATVQGLLKIDRIDLAHKEVQRIQTVDEDAIITQLALAWVNMAQGKEKLQEAFYIFQELIDKYGTTTLLLNSQASCLILQQKYEQAEQLMHEAMEKDSNNPDTLINLILLTQHLGKPVEQCNRYMSQLKDGFPNHPWTKEYVQKEKDFDRLCQQYEVSVS